MHDAEATLAEAPGQGRSQASVQHLHASRYCICPDCKALHGSHLGVFCDRPDHTSILHKRLLGFHLLIAGVRP